MYKFIDNVELPPPAKKRYPSRQKSKEEKLKIYKEKYTRDNKNRPKDYVRFHLRKSYHKMKRDDPEQLLRHRAKRKALVLKKLEEKAGRPKPLICEVCDKPGKICFDHCHNQGKFRGWICDSCNRALGHAKDSPDILRKLAEYLEKS